MENLSIKDLFESLCEKLKLKPETGRLVIGLYVPFCEIIYHKNCTIIFNATLFKDMKEARKEHGILIYPGKLILQPTYDDAMSDNGEEVQPYDANLIVGEDVRSNKKFLMVQHNDEQKTILLDEDEQNSILDIILNQCIICDKLYKAVNK